jgi:hypothetical protein
VSLAPLSNTHLFFNVRVHHRQIDLTGEEDETVKSELKGIKLFVKRGAKGFTGGMPGHLKLLARAGDGEERLRVFCITRRLCYDLTTDSCSIQSSDGSRCGRCR